MLALSPSSWFPTFGWPLDDHLGHDQNRWTDHDDPFINYNREMDCSGSFFDLSSPQPEVQINDPKKSGSTCDDDPSNLKKISHNANERDRRKKLNSLYSSLRSLLPMTDQKKKLSIPTTISLVLKYIPELQKQVERLTTRKEEILSQISRQKDPNHQINNRRDAHSTDGPSITATQVDEREVIIQICTLDIRRSTPLSEIVMKLEEEGFQVLNSSSFAAVGDKVFHNLHLQVMDSVKMECRLLSEKLLSLYRNKEELLLSYTDCI